MTAKQSESRARRIFDDLLNLEVDIIVKPGMTARKMPAPWEALGNIAETYDDLLSDFAEDVEPVWNERDHQPPIRVLSKQDAEAQGAKRSARVDVNGMLTTIYAGSTDAGSNEAGYDTFAELREWAVELAAVARSLGPVDDWPRREELEGKCVLFKRVYRNCDQLMAILKDKPHEAGGTAELKKDARLNSDELITVRKIWEVGTETVLMQTVVQLDGDVITRLHSGMTSSHKAVQDLHSESVKNAIQNWQFLAKTLVEILTTTLKRFL